MKKIALFPGCFDPIHKQHLAIIETVAKLKEIDELWILINHSSEEKNLILSFSDRKKLVELNLDKNCLKTKIFSTPINYYTTELIKKLKKEKPNNDFYLVLGADQAEQLPHWKKSKNLENLVSFFVFPRKNKQFDANLLKKFKIQLITENFLSNDTSSSEIKLGFNWKNLTSATINYIINNRLLFYSILEKKMSEKRLKHSLNVAYLAQKICRIYQFKNLKKEAFFAGLFHDLTKEFSKKEHLKIYLQENQNINNLQKIPEAIWHAKTSAIYVKNELCIKDEEIFKAIFFHTTGRKKMSNLEKIIFVADKLESPKQESLLFKIKFELFQTKKTFDEIFKITLNGMVNELKKKKVILTIETIEAVKYYLN